MLGGLTDCARPVREKGYDTQAAANALRSLQETDITAAQWPTHMSQMLGDTDRTERRQDDAQDGKAQGFTRASLILAVSYGALVRSGDE